MGKYIVRVTEKKIKEVVVDAHSADEAKSRGVAAIMTGDKHAA